MMLLSIVIALAQADTVTYSCPATRMEELLPVLSEKTGHTLKMSSKYEGTFVVVRFKETPVKDALDRLAKAMSGKFVVQGDQWILQPDPATADSHNDALQKALDKFLTPDPDKDTWDQKAAESWVKDAFAANESAGQSQDMWQKIHGIDARGPRHRMLQRIVKLLGAKSIIDAPLTGRTVYSSRPTRVQRPLPAGAAAAVEAYVKETKVRNEALEKRGVNRENPPQMNYYIQGLIPETLPDGGFDTAMLVVTRSLGNVNLQLRLKNSKSSESVTVDEGLPMFESQGPPGDKPQIAVEGDYVPSDTSKLVGRAMNLGMNRSAKDEPLTKEEMAQVKTIFGDLEKNELLRLAPSEILLQTAEALNKDLVARMSDAAVMAFALRGQFRDNGLKRYFDEGFSAWEVTEDEHGLTVGDSPLLDEIQVTLSRKPVSRFVREVDKSGVSIDAIADLVGGCPRGYSSIFAIMFGMIPFGGMESIRIEEESDAVLRAYALLDQASRAKAKQGGFVAQFRTLSPAIQTVVQNYVYNEGGGTSAAPLDLTGDYRTRSDDMDHDTTTVFGNGIPPDTLVTFQVKDVASLFAVTQFQGGPQMTQPVTEDAAASQIAMSERMSQATGRAQTVMLAQGKYQELTLAVQAAKLEAVAGRYRLMPTLAKSDLKTPEQMPDDIKKSLLEKLDKQRELYKNVDFRSGPPGKIKP